jgi:hypothetical protein
VSYAARETVVSALINAVISAAFFLAGYQGTALVPVWGAGGLAFDAVPQSFAIGFMATLVPGLMCRRALATGRIPGGTGTEPSIGWIFARAVLNGFVAAVAGTALWAAFLWLAGAETLAYAPAFVIKVAYGAALGALVTWTTLTRMTGPR